jgi:predicted DNA-binding transcriptional regulator AlpA
MNSNSELAEPTERGNGPSDLLTLGEVSNWLGLSTQWLEASRKNQTGPRAVKLGARTIRYRRCDVADWIEQQMKKTSADYAAAQKVGA